MRLEFHIPRPPSVNALYANNSGKGSRGRFNTSGYTAWLAEAGYALNQQRNAWAMLTGPVKVALTCNKGRADLGNMEKAVGDLMQAHGIYKNDSQIVSLLLTHDEQCGKVAFVTVEAV